MTTIRKRAAVRAPVSTVYAVWRNFENFPSFMRNIADVRAITDTKSRWIVHGPLGLTAEWDAELTVDEPNGAIGWRATDQESSVLTAGHVVFREDAPGRTLLDITIDLAPPGTPMGDIAARVFVEPERMVEEDLDRFRNIIEQATPGGG